MVEKVKKYKTEPLKCWQKAKEMREDYYKEYAEPNKLRVSGSAWGFDALLRGLGDDVVYLTSEPYGATISANPEFSERCLEACEVKGYARDLCAYLRSYLGSIFLDEYALGGKFPKVDFEFTSHICCTHAKWAERVAEYEGAPCNAIDVSVGPYNSIKPYKVDYIAGQMLDAIEWMEKITGREYDDEKLIEGVYEHCRSTALWAEICELNKAVPAPLEVKSMFSLYVLSTLKRASKEVGDFYEELIDEVKDRVARGIAAVPAERFRIIDDSQPPWAFLKIFRYLEKFGVVDVGSLYLFALIGIMEEKEDGTYGAAKTPQQRGIKIKNREEACRVLTEWSLKQPVWAEFYSPDMKSQLMKRIVKEWKSDAAIIHLNRGCEGTAIGQSENRLALLEAGIPVLTYEGNMADAREFDEARTWARVDSFMESLDLKIID